MDGTRRGAVVGVDRTGVRIVLETETTMPKGPHDLALVATEPATGQIATGSVSGLWEGMFPSGVATPVTSRVDGRDMEISRPFSVEPTN
jgi:hypothetical protein